MKGVKKMYITDFELDGSLRRGGFAFGNKLLYQGIYKDKYHRFIVKGVPRYIFYFTVDKVLSVSEGEVENFGQFSVLKVPFNNTCLFFEIDVDYKNWIYRGYLSNNGIKWEVYKI
jgi:hypothetical protein